MNHTEVEVLVGETVPRPTRDELYDLYVVQGMEARDIAQRYEVVRQTVWVWLKELGIERPPHPWNRETIRGLREAMDISQAAFARRFDPPVDQRTVARWESPTDPQEPEEANRRQMDEMAQEVGYEPETSN